MFINLKTAMDRENITMEELAATLNVHRNTVTNKLSGLTPFTYEEVLMIQKILFPCYELSWLFKKIAPTENK